MRAVADLSFAVISPARAVDEISAQVRSMVADGRLKPGDRLPSERELAPRLQVSRNTLREALRTLEHAGLIEMRKGASGGAFVRTGSGGVIITGLSDLYHLGGHIAAATDGSADLAERPRGSRGMRTRHGT